MSARSLGLRLVARTPSSPQGFELPRLVSRLDEALRIGNGIRLALIGAPLADRLRRVHELAQRLRSTLDALGDNDDRTPALRLAEQFNAETREAQQLAELLGTGDFASDLRDLR